MRIIMEAARKGVFLFVLLSLLIIGFPLQAANQNQPREPIAGSEGNVKVIIKLQVPQINKLIAAANKFRSPDSGKEPTWSGSQADTALMNAITVAAQGLLEKLKGTAYGVHHIYKSIPYMAIEVSTDGLAILRSSPEVLGIEEDIPMKLIEPIMDNGQPKGNNFPSNIDPPLLDTSVNLIGANTAWSMGYTGSGRYVAILDTGIRSTHEFFNGKTIIEACYAKGSDGLGPVGDCPNGLISMTGAGSAIHYPNTYQGYDHGTHVAGIATGNNGVLFGVAKNADIIAVKVFSMFPETEPACSGVSCVLSWNSDQLAGLDYIYTIRGSYSIAAVNMSIGGGSNASACDSDARKAVIDNLRAAGIATAIATGNNGYCGSISSPACISTSVAVGSSTDLDKESGFNNWHPTMQKLFAPGSTIYSSTGDSNNSYASWNGTSMATPHVAGAWALMKQAKSTATVTEVLSALQSTGFPIISTCPGNTAPISRIQVNTAINALSYTVSGTIRVSGVTPLAGVVMNGLPGNPATDASGVYTANVAFNWSGTVTPARAGYSFTPTHTDYSSVTTDQLNQDYTATLLIYAISGTIKLSGVTPLAGVVMNGLPGNPITDVNGFYLSTITYNGATVTPALSGYTFTPHSRPYTNVIVSQPNQDYTATVSSGGSSVSGGGGGGGGGCFIAMTTQPDLRSGLDRTTGKINLALLISLSGFFGLLAWYEIRLKKTGKN